MSVAFNCQACRHELEAPGAILFSDPRGPGLNLVDKFHLCVSCYGKVLEFLELLRSLPPGADPLQFQLTVEGYHEIKKLG